MVPNVVVNIVQALADWSRYLLGFGLAYVFTFALVPAIIRLAPRIGMVDIPDARRVHTQPTPRGGGIAVWIGFHLALYVMTFVIPEIGGRLSDEWWLGFLAASSVLLIVGIVDDAFGTKPEVKLGGQFAAAAVLVNFTGTGFGSLLGMSLPPWLDLALTLGWYVGIINAFNLIDGLDGLCSGLAMIGAVGLGLSFVIMRETMDVLPTLVLAGACLGFLRYNFHPARIFLGDSGSMFLGFALASFALETGNKSTFVVSVGIAVLAVGVPLFDTLLAIWRRSIRKMLAGKDGKGVMSADKDHLHHRLLASGMSQRAVAVAMYCGSALLVAAGLLTIVAGERALAIYLMTLIFVVYVTVRHIAHIELWDTGMALSRGLANIQTRLMTSIAYVAWDIIAVALALAFAFLVLPDPSWRDSIGIRERWIRELPFWLFPIFASLVLFKNYQRVWSKAGARDFFILQASLAIGWLVVVSLQILLSDSTSAFLWPRSIIFGGAMYVLIVPSRSIAQVVQMMLQALAFENPLGRGTNPQNILIYGVTERSLLLLRHLDMLNPGSQVYPRVVGLLDDDRNVRKRLVKGHQVIGGLNDLPEILERQDIHQIVLACDLSSARRKLLWRISQDYGILVTEWDYRLHQLSLESREGAPGGMSAVAAPQASMASGEASV